MDFWNHYRERFKLPDGQLIFPDWVAVMDESPRAAMIAEGFPADRLKIVGLPAFDELVKYQSSTAAEAARTKLREMLPVMYLLSRFCTYPSRFLN